MHGGFENETPNIPTNSIMKIDLAALVKGNANLTQKLELACGGNPRGSSPGGNSQGGKGGSTASSDNNSRPTTPPMQSLAKKNNPIRMGKAEVEL